MSYYIIYTVNNKAVKIIEKHTYTWLVQFVKTGKYASVNKNYIKSFKKYKKQLKNQLKLQL